MITSILRRVAHRLLHCAEKIEEGGRLEELDRWRRDRGDLTLRLNYTLTAASEVWDVGGYEGQWASDIVARFGCRVNVFEPMPAAASAIRLRFASNPLVRVYGYALGAKNQNGLLSSAADASRLIDAGAESDSVPVEIRDIMEVWRSLGSAPVALMKINIEGAEYDLIERMAEAGMLAHVAEIQVQFHAFVPQAKERKERVAALLMKTHEQSWGYEFVWENWRRRSIAQI